METQMKKSDSIAKLAEALAKAQGEFSPVIKDCTNPFYKSKYADLASIVDAVREALAKNGLSHIQLAGSSEAGEAVVTTVLLHASGEFISGELTLPVGKADAQGFGSALTYARRYGLQAILGVAAEDDDGNASVGDKTAKKEKPTHIIQCDECNHAVVPFRKPGGEISSVEQIVNASILKHKKTLCAQCQLDIAAIEKQERVPAKEPVKELDGTETITVAEVNETTKGYLKVKWYATSGEKEASVWDKKLWPLFDLAAGKKFVVKIETKESKGKTYNNIVDVLKVGEFAVEDGELVVHLTSKDTQFANV